MKNILLTLVIATIISTVSAQTDVCFSLPQTNEFYCGDFEYCSSSGAPFTYSKGIYRIPFLEFTSVHVDLDHITDCPRGSIDMHATGAQYLTFYVVAAADGWVRAHKDICATPGCNNFMWIEHPNGEWTFYKNLTPGSISDDLKNGDWITAGTVIGEEGYAHSSDTVKDLYFVVVVPVDTNEIVYDNDYGYPKDQWTDRRIPLFCGVSDNLLKYNATYTALTCGSSCDAFIPFLDATYGAGEFKTFIDDEALSTTSNITFDEASASVIQSSSSVTLNPGFYAKEFSFFEARIGECSGAVFNKAIESNAAEITNGISIAPNPAASNAVLKWQMNVDADVSIKVCDAAGRILFQPINSESRSKGFQQQSFDVSSLTSGIYLVVLEMNQSKEIRKLVVQR